MGHPIRLARTFFARGIVLGTLLLPLLSACSGEKGADSPTPSSDGPTAGGTLVVAAGAEPDALNSFITTSGYSTRINALLNDSMLSMNDRFEFEPNLAESWTWSDDRLEVTFYLRKGLRWSDGEPFSAHDVESTFDMFTDPDIASSRASNFVDIESVTAVDSHTVRIRYNRRTVDQLFNANMSLFPKHVADQLDRRQASSWPTNRKPVGTGPYRLLEWESGEQIVLERNPHYFKNPPRPYIDRIVFRFTPDPTVRMLQLETGEVDFLERVSFKDYERIRNSNTKIRFYPLSGRKFGYLVYNVEHPFLSDARVRRAISHAVDRRAFIDNLMYGYGQLGSSIIVPMLAWAHDSDLPPDELDPERSRRLLAEAGFVDIDGDGVVEKDGEPFEIELLTRTGDSVRENGALVLQENLARIGIRAKLRMMEHAASLQTAREGDFDIFYAHYGSRMSVDPTMLVTTGGSINYGGYSNPEVDELVRLGVVELDRDKARRIWHKFQAAMAEEQPWSVLYYYDDLVGINDRFRGCTPDNLSPFWDIENWWCAEPKGNSN